MPDQPAPAAVPDAVRVPCRDALGRPGELTVLRRDHRLVLLAPPAQAATLDAPVLAVLADVLTAARADLNHAAGRRSTDTDRR